MEKYTIRRMLPGDCEDILAAIKELATALKAEDQVMISEEILMMITCNIEEQKPKENHSWLCVVLYYVFIVGRKKAFMEDLYVKPNHQRNGVGTRLWRTAVKEALKDGCNQMEWGAYSWNTSALEFYKRQGAINMTDIEQFHTYKLTYESMHTFANSGEKTE